MRYIYCQPLFDERKCAYRFSFQLRTLFKTEGLTLERFDYRGTGEAEGEFADITLQTLREDVTSLVDGDKVCLVGLRFGASLALDYCVKSSRPPSCLVLLEPVISGIKYCDYLHRKQHIKNLMTGKIPGELQESGYINIEGYKTNVKLIDQIEKFDLFETASRNVVKIPVFIVQISSQQKIQPQITKLAKLLEKSSEKVCVENVELPIFWERIPCTDYTILVQKVLRWCHG